MTEWTDLVKRVYNENKGNHGYKLGDAMKEAKKQYKRASKVSASIFESKPTKKRRGKARKTRKNKKFL